jgi:transcription initiation factor IIE alpha subunit
MTGTFKDQLLALMVCADCGAPVEFDKSDKCYRHKEPLDRHCKKNGYPVKAKVKTN